MLLNTNILLTLWKRLCFLFQLLASVLRWMDGVLHEHEWFNFARRFFFLISKYSLPNYTKYVCLCVSVRQSIEKSAEKLPQFILVNILNITILLIIKNSGKCQYLSINNDITSFFHNSSCIFLNSSHFYAISG